MKIQNHPGAWGVLAGLLVFLIGVVATCASCALTRMPAPTITATEQPRTPQEELASTYFVTTTCLLADESGTIHGGSSVMIDAHHLLTARHVVRCENGGYPSLRVTRADGRESFDAYVQKVWATKDVALLYVRYELPGRPARIATGLPRIGDMTCAHVANPHFGASCGEVTDIRTDNPDGEVYVVTVYVRGNSGGGVYIDGVLYGVVTHFVPCAMKPEESCGGNFSSIAGLL